MKEKIFEGTCTALVTPFNTKNEIDYDAAKRIVEFQIENQVDAILILGSTGESFSLSTSERQKFISFVRSLVPKTVKLIVGAGSNICEEAIRLVSEAEALGADACLVQTPFFCKCTQNGIFQHFKKICKSVNLPIIVYNIPSRSGVNILPETMHRLCEIEKIAGLKEANGDIEHVLKMANTIGDEIAFYCGNDNLYPLFLALGCSGTISVTSNVFPAEIVKMWQDGKRALEIHNRLFKFNNLMFCEPNPIPVKYALSKLGKIENALRLPLTSLEESHEKEIDEQLKILGALK